MIFRRTPLPRTRLAFVFAIVVALAGARARDPDSMTPEQRASLLHQWAVEALGEPAPEARQRALRDILAAIEIAPDDPGHWLVLGRIRVLGEYDDASRQCFRRAVVLDPGDFDAWLELGAAWKREWARTLDTLALRRAMGALDTAAALRPGASEPWLRLVPLRFEAHDFGGATRAASRALAGRPRKPESLLAAAYVAFHQGQIQRSDSLFHVALPSLDKSLAQLFREPSSLLGKEAPPRGFQGLDPDPTTPENEIELEYWSRVAHAFLLFDDQDRGGLDARFQTYVQYGPPSATVLDPAGVPLYFRTSTMPSSGQEPAGRFNPGKPPVEFPTPIQLWAYPDLGMRVLLQDRSLHGRFQPRTSVDFDPMSRPDPAVLATRADLVGFPGAVFHRLPPGEQRIETRGVLARFAASQGPSVMAQVEVPGTPADSIRARFVVRDASGREVARGAGMLGIDACDPGARRRGQFVAELHPGVYDVTVSVSGPDGKRGLFQRRATLEAEPRGLSLSDLVLSCGDPSVLVGGSSARFDASVDSRVSGRSLAGYVEIYGLSPGPDGLARFESVCRVRRAPSVARRGDRDDRAVLVSTSREDSQPGMMRRQFVVVPIAAVPPGAYELELTVRDQVSGAAATRSVPFVRE